MSYWFMIPFLVGAGVSLHLSYKAYTHLSDDGRIDPIKVMFLGSFAGRRYFTDQGWGYRNAAIRYGLAGFAITALLIIAFA